MVSVERETFPGMIASGEVVLGYPARSYWLDVGTPAAFVQGSCDLVLGRLASPALPGACGEYLALPGAQVSPSAKIAGGTVVGPRAVIESDASVRGSVLDAESVVESGAIVVDSVVGAGARVASGAVLRDAVIGDHAVVGPGNELVSGARVWPGVHLPPYAGRFSSDV